MGKYRTASIPKGLADDIKQFIDDVGYWPGFGSFVREAAIEKLHRERERLRPLKGEAEG